MKRYLCEILIFLIQLFIFYIFPMFVGPTDSMGMVLIIIIVTFILSIIYGITIRKKTKYFYPLIVGLVFIPSVFIYYNDSALIHSIWYFVDSAIGILIGIIINNIIKRK